MKTRIPQQFLRKQTFIPPVCKIVTLPETRDDTLHRGVRVTEGQRITKKGIYPSVHASIPGIIQQTYLTTHAFGHTVEVIEIALDGHFDFSNDTTEKHDWRTKSARTHISAIKNLGVTTSIPGNDGIDTILLNACEQEPGIRHNLALFCEYYAFIIEHLALILYLFRARHIYICLDDRIKHFKHVAARCIEEHQYNNVTVKVVPPYRGIAYYNDTLLMQHCKVAPKSACVISIEPLIQMFEAVLYRRPVRKQTVYVYGNAVKKPTFMYAHIGAPLSQLVETLVPNTDDLRIVLNGMFTGTEVVDLNYPLDPSIHAIEIGTREKQMKELPCISCGACTAVCPVNLEPHLLYKILEADSTASLQEFFIDRCISCGLCSYVCPSRIPLSHRIIQNKQSFHADKSSGDSSK